MLIAGLSIQAEAALGRGTRLCTLNVYIRLSIDAATQSSPGKTKLCFFVADIDQVRSQLGEKDFAMGKIQG
jgi:hypothetical protein